MLSGKGLKGACAGAAMGRRRRCVGRPAGLRTGERSSGCPPALHNHPKSAAHPAVGAPFREGVLAWEAPRECAAEEL